MKHVEYEYKNLPIPGGGYVTGFIYHQKQKGLLYARTDIGGVYRFEQKAQRWKSLIGHVTMEDISVPFMISNRGYGFFWNNPAIGTATFGTNVTQWYAKSTKKLDYFITAGDSPAQLEEQYSLATGRTPMMPEYGLGYWQCKLRYRTQDELMAVAREHKRRGLPMDAIVIDFFHWTMQGDFKFEPLDWPDPEAMVKALKELGIETVVSVWPTIDERSENFGKMSDMGYLVNADRGNQNHMTWMGNTVFYDATHPQAQKFVWERCKENYYKYGIRCFWLDEAEPEYGPYDFYEDKHSWEIEDSYMFGPDLLVSPVMEANVTSRKVYLPKGATWTDAYTKKVYEGGQTVEVEAPLDIIPIMIKDGKKYDIYID